MREIIILTPFKVGDGHWSVPLLVALVCLCKCWCRSGEQNMVIANGKAHLGFARHRGASVASITISVIRFSDLNRYVWSSSLLPILCF